MSDVINLHLSFSAIYLYFLLFPYIRIVRRILLLFAGSDRI